MPRKDKPFQNANSALASVWGTPTAGNRGVSVKKTATARRAGVTMDHPLTDMAQKLAAELLTAQTATENILDPRSDFEKEYNIHDKTAHLTPETFRDLLISHHDLERLKRNVDCIYINDGHGLSAIFRFQVSDEESLSTDVIPSQHIIEQGLSSGLKGQKKVILRLRTRNLGVLEAQSVPENLSLHAQEMLSADGITQQHSVLTMLNPLETVLHTGNLRDLFNKATSLKEELSQRHSRGIPITVSAYRKRKEGAFQIGTLLNPDRVYDTDIKLGKITCAALMNKDTVYIPTRNREEFLSNFFNGTSGFIITFKRDVLGVLLRDDMALHYL